MNDLLTSYIRTVVPVLVGSVASWLLTLGLELDAETQASAVVALTGLLIAGYYAVVRAVERRYPRVGVLLGKPAEVTYIQPGNGKRIKTED